jgi:hypothetical protein
LFNIFLVAPFQECMRWLSVAGRLSTDEVIGYAPF